MISSALFEKLDRVIAEMLRAGIPVAELAECFEAALAVNGANVNKINRLAGREK